MEFAGLLCRDPYDEERQQHRFGCGLVKRRKLWIIFVYRQSDSQRKALLKGTTKNSFVSTVALAVTACTTAFFDNTLQVESYVFYLFLR